MGKTSARVDMVVANNGTWEDAFQFGTLGDTTWSFVGMAFHMDIKASRPDVTALFSLTSAGGTIVVDDAVARILHFNVDFVTLKAALPVGEYVYDLVMLDGGSPAVRVPLMGGEVEITQGVTQT